MINITATEFKNRLGKYLDMAETDPVFVKKSGRQKSVLISQEMYKKFLALEDNYWAQKALEAEAEGYLGEKDSGKVLKDLANV
jgi:antitoxin Phd